jgi:REP element-mobilizing transposase RayT
MSGPLGIALEDGWYHFINRGIERRSIFRSAADYRHLVELLAQLPEWFGILIHRYAHGPARCGAN